MSESRLFSRRARGNVALALSMLLTASNSGWAGAVLAAARGPAGVPAAAALARRAPQVVPVRLSVLPMPAALRFPSHASGRVAPTSAPQARALVSPVASLAVLALPASREIGPSAAVPAEIRFAGRAHDARAVPVALAAFAPAARGLPAGRLEKAASSALGLAKALAGSSANGSGEAIEPPSVRASRGFLARETSAGQDGGAPPSAANAGSTDGKDWREALRRGVLASLSGIESPEEKTRTWTLSLLGDAALILGDADASAVLAVLEKGLDDPAQRVRWQAGHVLDRVAGALPARGREIFALVGRKASGEENAFVRSGLLRFLVAQAGRLRDAEAAFDAHRLMRADPDGEVRYGAVSALEDLASSFGRERPRELFAAYREMMGSGDPRSKRASAYRLDKLVEGAGAGGLSEALELYRTGLKDEDVEARANVARSLRAFAPLLWRDRPLDLLALHALAAGNPAPQVRASAVEALGAIATLLGATHPGEIFSAYDAARRDADEVAREQAPRQFARVASALGEPFAGAMLGAYGALLQDPAERVRLQAAWEFERAAAVLGSRRASGLLRLQQEAVRRGEAGEARRWTARALGVIARLMGSSGAGRLLRAYAGQLGSSDPSVRAATLHAGARLIEALGSSAAARVWELSVRMLKDGGIFEREALAQSLAALAGPLAPARPIEGSYADRALAVAYALLKDPEARVREGLARDSLALLGDALSAGSGADLLGLHEAALSDADPDVRRAAAYSFGTWAKHRRHAPDVLRVYRVAMQDEDQFVRARLVFAFLSGMLRRPVDEHQIFAFEERLALWEEGMRDASAEVRRSVAWNAGPLAAAARRHHGAALESVYRRMLGDESPSVRAVGLRALVPLSKALEGERLPALFQALEQGLEDAEPDVREAAAYTAGVFLSGRGAEAPGESVRIVLAALKRDANLGYHALAGYLGKLIAKAN